MPEAQRIKDALIAIKKNRPLVLCLTNLVTINDCANILLALGAAPVMSDDMEDAKQLTSLASSLCLNIGTINKRQLEIMLSCSAIAYRTKIPVLLDPVGAGASSVRLEACQKILDNAQVHIVKANAAEVMALTAKALIQKGVDSGLADNFAATAAAAGKLAKNYGCCTAVTGATDIISNGSKERFISGGHPFMTRISGTGCMLGAMCSAYMAVSSPITAASAAMLHMTVAAERALDLMHMQHEQKIGSLKAAVLDNVSSISPADLFEEALKRLS